METLHRAVVVVVELPQTLENDLRRATIARGMRKSWSQLVHVCKLVMAMVGWVRSEIEVADGMYARQIQGGGRTSGDAGALLECDVIHGHNEPEPSRGVPRGDAAFGRKSSNPAQHTQLALWEAHNPPFRRPELPTPPCISGYFSLGRGTSR